MVVSASRGGRATGLGHKTIEAGLVIAQTRAEGAQRILQIVPQSLIGQWQNELLNLFGIEARGGSRQLRGAGAVSGLRLTLPPAAT